MSPSIQSKLFLAKYSLVKWNCISYFRELLRNQHLPSAELEQLSWRRTRHLLDYAYEHVPYYRERFRKIGLHPNDISRPEYFSQVPLLRREDLQSHFDSLLSKKVSRRSVRLSTTGGSTGQPVKVLHQKNVVRAAAGWRMQTWWGLPPGTDVASIYRDTRTSLSARLLSGLIWWPLRRTILNAANLSNAEMERFVGEYRRNPPPLVHGYVNALNYVASWLEDSGVSLPPPKAIWATSAPLNSVQKERIERVFQAPVYDQYGCCEIYWLAAQCPEQDGLHLFSDIRRFEILDDGLEPLPIGQPGQIVVTDLENECFPLIRYVNGDRGRLRRKPCKCDINLPVMDKVLGRLSDNLLLPDGTHVSGEFMTTVFDDEPDVVKQFRVRQHRDYSVEIEVVPNDTHPGYESALKKIEKHIDEQLQGKLPVRISLKERIELTKGKMKFIDSELT